MSEKEKQSFILASASPRRKELLEEAGYDFTVEPSNVDESQHSTDNKPAEYYAIELAFAKAIDVAVRFPQKLAIAADTVVDLDGEIIGKPDDAKDAERITRLLFAKPHKVVTAIAFMRLEPRVEMANAETTIVYPKALSEEQIAEHIKSENWKDKAGGYGLQDTEDEFVAKIEGSFSNVVGMPMELLEKMLEQLKTNRR